ncbi:MAG TPA: alpha-amylase family glycosyl hydrolase [Catalimonadaceae bacterium]|nr:alpha-amylase family glycosyl hydrolase [Catalimonadaceae bacterium]
MFKKFMLAAFIAACLGVAPVQAQATKVKKVVFQGFWWDYWNNNFSNGWSNYLTELAPRLKSMGVDAIWIPPSYRNGSTGSVGYGPFDEYDLGDKYQKGSVRTRMGTKDELLRMVAVMHANGIEVIQDVVLNHTSSAGSNTGAGGQDPEVNYSMRNQGGYKNFRYVSYVSPAIDESQNDYFTRSGRWPKNYPNFYPNLNNNCTTGDICSDWWGPDISYESTAYGQSSNVPTTGTVTVGGFTRSYFNPSQGSNYMRDNGRNWLMRLKKQTGVDGWRWDAVKHFPIYVQEDYTYNTKYVLPAWAQGGEAMFNVGEWIGNKSELDAYVTNVRSGTEEHTGTFDFSLRGYGPNGGVYGMVLGTGAYNLQNMPGEQQDKRYYNYSTQRVHRTVPFVNSHDTYRPRLDASGNFLKPLGDASGWDTGNEVGGNGQHIDPREPRLYAAYATIFSVDGNPTVFFEDLFDIGTTGKRWSHLPSSTVDLPVREDIANIMRAHGKLQFKNGDYAVATSRGGAQAPYYATGGSGDHVVFERIGKAIIGVTDAFSSVANNTADQQVWVSVGDASWNGKALIDYSGAHGVTTSTVQADGRVLIKTAPCGHTISGARGHGYSIWAPIPTGVTFSTVNDIYNYLMTYNPGRSTLTTQEWEMANDLGDSHASSLKQGGALPTNSTAQRTVGRIYVNAGSPVSYKLYPEVNGRSQNMALYNTSGTILSQVTGTSSNTAPLSGTYTPTAAGWLTIKVKNSNATTAGMKVWVNTAYTAPTTVNTRTSPGNLRVAVEDESEGISTEELNTNGASIEVYPNPTTSDVNFTFQNLGADEVMTARLVDLKGRELLVVEGTQADMQAHFNKAFADVKSGIYILSVDSHSLNQRIRLVKK